jgi:hypothetical protein
MSFRKKSLFIFLFMHSLMGANAQTSPVITEYRSLQLEALAEKKETEPEDDEYEMDLTAFSKHPLNLNEAGEEDLVQLHIPDVLQIRNFISYRKLLGPLISVHEMQAVPGWDIEMIHKLLPYIIVSRDESVYSAMKERWKGGDFSFLIRGSRVIEKSKGFEKPVKPGLSYYEGSAEKIFVRYNYNYKQLLSFGFTGEKDAGEPFLRGAQHYGFDFYSFHFFLQRSGVIRALAIGDFTVNLGQGLIQWQTIAFTKSSQALAVKREAFCLRPYHAAGEFNFHRGLGISLQKGKWQSGFFISSQKISTNLEPDTSGKEDLFSSFQQSGYHRTPAEIADRNNSRQISAGGNIRYTGRNFLLGFNWIHFYFSRPFQKREEPYNLYSLKGTGLKDYSLDYNYTLGNLHLFGEIAADHWRRFAFVQGALVSLHEKLDMSFVYRNISPEFHSLYSDAFTESSVPANENGLYLGFAFRPFAGVQVNLYYDVFVFPWLKYRVDAPSRGKDFLLQTVYQPIKSWHLTTLYKNEFKMINAEVLNSGTHGLTGAIKQRWRIDSDYMLSRSFSFTGRMEYVRINFSDSPLKEGFLGTAGLAFSKSGFSGNISATVFETSGYDARIYIYEPDLLYNFSLPSYYGSGIRYYLNLHRDLSRLISRMKKQFHLSAWLKWGQTFYPGAGSVGSGLDEIKGGRKSEIKIQVLVQWQ